MALGLEVKRLKWHRITLLTCCPLCCWRYNHPFYQEQQPHAACYPLHHTITDGQDSISLRAVTVTVTNPIQCTELTFCLRFITFS